MICLISQPLLIASRRDWYQSKGLLKGFKLALRPWESSKNWWRYDQMKFVTPTFYFLPYDILSLYTFYTVHTSLLLHLYTTLILIGMFSPVLLYHNTSLLSSSTLSLNSFFILATPLMAWPHILPPLSLLSLIFFLFPMLLPLQGMPALSVGVPLMALLHVPPFPFFSTIDTSYICAPFLHTYNTQPPPLLLFLLSFPSLHIALL